MMPAMMEAMRAMRLIVKPGLPGNDPEIVDQARNRRMVVRNPRIAAAVCVMCVPPFRWMWLVV